VAADATPADETTVGAYMSTDVETVGPDDPFPVAACRMLDAGIGHAPVTDADGNGVGILTTTDLAAALSGVDAPSPE